jgi:hypothetical protein
MPPYPRTTKLPDKRSIVHTNAPPRKRGPAIIRQADAVEAAGAQRSEGFYAISRDKDWEIEDIDEVYLGEDGELFCYVKWKRSRLNAKLLVGENTRDRLKELTTRSYGFDSWNTWNSKAEFGQRGRRKRVRT